MNDKTDIAKRMLELKVKQPEYQRLDIEPKAGGSSLFHDEFGMPKTGNSRTINIPPAKEIDNTPVLIKASKKIQSDDEDDKFIPPKTNFVSVGHVEHAWYDEKVTGPSIIDNNDKVDIESLQGLNPLADVDPTVAKSVEFFKKRLAYLKGFVAAELLEVDSLEDLNELKRKTVGKKGVFTEILKQLGSAPASQRPLIGSLINEVYSDIQLEFEGKNFELTSEDEEVTEWPEDMAVITKEDVEDNEEETEDDEEDSEDSDGDVVEEPSPTVPEGHYAIIVDGNLLEVIDNLDSARSFISHLILNENVNMENIQLIKRIKIDFGIILGD